MVRPIDANALMRDIEQYHLSDGMFQHWVEVQPTIDAVPERTGVWSEEYDPNDDPFFRRKFRCSACNGWNTYGFTRYCPECGAKMLNASALTQENKLCRD